MGIPQTIWLLLASATIGMHLAKDGEPQGNYRFSTALIGAALMTWILHAGGFFSGGNC